MFNLFNTKPAKDEIVEEVVKESIEEEIVEQPKDEWVWVNGIKGMTCDMKGQNDFQFEVGRTYTVDGEVELCRNGFHFSKNLNDASYYYSSSNSRFFRVNGLVRKSDLESYSSYVTVYSGQRRNKLAARKIIILSEILDSEYVEFLRNDTRFIETMEDVKDLWRAKRYDLFIRARATALLKEAGYSDTFTMVFLDRFDGSPAGQEKMAFFAKALAEEGVSKDMAVMLLFKEDVI